MVKPWRAYISSWNQLSYDQTVITQNKNAWASNTLTTSLSQRKNLHTMCDNDDCAMMSPKITMRSTIISVYHDNKKVLVPPNRRDYEPR